MPSSPKATDPLHVVIAGGGVAGLEALIALRQLAGDRVRITLVDPGTDFVYRPLSVGEPFATAARSRYPLARIAADMTADLVRDAVVGIHADAHSVVLGDGGELRYDALLLALGAIAQPAYEHAITFGADPSHEALHGLLADAETGYTRHLGFVVPPATSWTLPLYELALSTARQVRGLGIDDLDITLVTPESQPLEIFGAQASRAVADLLADAGVRFIGGRIAHVTHDAIIPQPSDPPIAVQRVVSLPRLTGPRIDGLPADIDGFVWVNRHGQAVGLEDVYAAGDITEFPIKQGGLAAQQADAAAETIAAAAGVALDPQPFRPVLRGMLLVGRDQHFLRNRVGQINGGTAREQPLWWPPAKVAGRYLAPYLFDCDLTDLASDPSCGHVTVDLDLPVAVAYTTTNATR